MEPMCCILRIGLLVRFKDGTNVLLYLRQDCWQGSRIEPMCCILKTGLLVRFKDGTNVLYT